MLFMLAKYWLSSVKQAIFNITFYASHKLVGKLQRSLTSFLLTGMPKTIRSVFYQSITMIHYSTTWEQFIWTMLS